MRRGVAGVTLPGYRRDSASVGPGGGFGLIVGLEEFAKQAMGMVKPRTDGPDRDVELLGNGLVSHRHEPSQLEDEEIPLQDLLDTLSTNSRPSSDRQVMARCGRLGQASRYS